MATFGNYGPGPVADAKDVAEQQNRQCGCGKQVALRMSKSQKNFARWYFCCPDADRAKTQGCSYWSWTDTQPKFSPKVYGAKRARADFENGGTVLSGDAFAVDANAQRQILARMSEFSRQIQQMADKVEEVLVYVKGSDGTAPNFSPVKEE
jgi:hypothetical protein